MTTTTAKNGHIVTTEPSTAHVIVTATDGTVIADSTSGHVLHESNIQDRWYIPLTDVKLDYSRTETTSHCPYKGDATYWTVQLPDGRQLKDVAWSYEAPFEAAEEVQSEVSFWGGDVQVTVNGDAVQI